MTRIPRVLVGWALVAALVAVFVGCASASRGAVAAALVGRWKGGSHSNGQWFYEFSADGRYRTWPERNPDTSSPTGAYSASTPNAAPGWCGIFPRTRCPRPYWYRWWTGPPA